MNRNQSVATHNARALCFSPGKSWRCFVILLSWACHCFVTNGAFAVTWNYQIVYDGINIAPLAGRTIPGLNDSGTLAFRAQVGSTYGIVTGNGGPVTVIATEGTTYKELADNPGINNNGLVLFDAKKPNGTMGIYTSNGSGTPTSINGSLTGSFIHDLGLRNLNDSGQVAFNAYSGSSLHFYTGNGGVPQLISNDSQGAWSDINNSGDIVWSTGDTVSQYNAGVYTVIQTTSGIFGSFGGAPSINNAGDMSFVGTLDGGSSALAIYHAGSTSITTESPTGFTWFRGISVINDLGMVAFTADTATSSGIFVGLDPTQPPVLYQGMSLFGSTANEINFEPHGFNNLGQLAFMYSLSDGRLGLGIATPVPEPTTFVLATIGLVGAVICRHRKSLVTRR